MRLALPAAVDRARNRPSLDQQTCLGSDADEDILASELAACHLDRSRSAQADTDMHLALRQTAVLHERPETGSISPDSQIPIRTRREKEVSAIVRDDADAIISDCQVRVRDHRPFLDPHQPEPARSGTDRDGCRLPFVARRLQRPIERQRRNAPVRRIVVRITGDRGDPQIGHLRIVSGRDDDWIVGPGLVAVQRHRVVKPRQTPQRAAVVLPPRHRRPQPVRRVGNRVPGVVHGGCALMRHREEQENPQGSRKHPSASP